jgi:RNA polymerase sigma-70 factor (ECF subfamily)
MLASLEARDEFADAIQREHEREVFDEAMVHVQTRVSAQSWDAFRLQAIEGKSGAETARELGISVAAAYMARSRVQSALREAVAAIDGDK